MESEETRWATAELHTFVTILGYSRMVAIRFAVNQMRAATLSAYTGSSVLVVDELGYLSLTPTRRTGSSRSGRAAMSAARSC